MVKKVVRGGAGVTEYKVQWKSGYMASGKVGVSRQQKVQHPDKWKDERDLEMRWSKEIWNVGMRIGTGRVVHGAGNPQPRLCEVGGDVHLQ